MTIQETKLNAEIKTPDIPDYATICIDRMTRGGGGGLITYIHHSIHFTEIPTHALNNNIETIVAKLDTNPPLYISNCYVPPRVTQNYHN